MSDNFSPQFTGFLPVNSSTPQPIPNTSTSRLQTETEPCSALSCPRKRRRRVSSATKGTEGTGAHPPKVARTGRKGRVLCQRCREGRHGWPVLTSTPLQSNCISALKTVEIIPVLVFNVKKTVLLIKNVVPKLFLRNVPNEDNGRRKWSCSRKYCF